MFSVQLLDELEDRYGTQAVITAGPYVDEPGGTLRWFVQVDGEEVSDLDVATRPDPERDDVMLMVLVRGGEQIELARWHEDSDNPLSIKAGAPYQKDGPAHVVWTVGELRRLHARRSR